MVGGIAMIIHESNEDEKRHDPKYCVNTTDGCAIKNTLPVEIQTQLTELEYEFLKNIRVGKHSSVEILRKRDVLLKDTGVAATWKMVYMRNEPRKKPEIRIYIYYNRVGKPE